MTIFEWMLGSLHVCDWLAASLEVLLSMHILLDMFLCWNLQR